MFAERILSDEPGIGFRSLDGSCFADDFPPPRAAAGVPGGRRRPRHDLLLPADRFQGPSRAEFNASLEDPFYEPFDRLLLRHKRRIVAHVHLTHRTMHFGAMPIPAAAWVAGRRAGTPGQGLGTHLLRAAESRMAIGGALVGMLRTSIPRFFRRTGWALCGQASYRRADARALLARLLDRGLIPRPRRRLHIRPWLQWEQAALARIYTRTCKNGAVGRDAADGHVPAHARHGPLERTDAYWQWLLNRHAYDQVYVALEGPEQLELGEISTRIVGYAVTRGEQIVELMTAPDRPRAAAELLARCCGDAIEHDRHCVLLHAPPGCPLFEIFDEAGGCGPLACAGPRRGVHDAAVGPAGAIAAAVRPVRSPRRGGPPAAPVGLGPVGRRPEVPTGAWGREGVAVTSQRVGRSYLRLNVADFTRLVLGQLDWDAAIADGRLECSTALARRGRPGVVPLAAALASAVGRDAGRVESQPDMHAFSSRRYGG